MKRIIIHSITIIAIFLLFMGCSGGTGVKDTPSGNSLNSVNSDDSERDTPASPVRDASSWTGIKSFWTYDSDSIGGAGSVMVNLKSGNLVYQQTDVSFPGRGLPVEFRLTYNSDSQYEGVFSRGWSHIFEARLDIAEDSVKLTDGYGGEFSFTNPVLQANGNTKYTAPPGRNSIFIKRADGKYVETKKNKSRYIFDENGRLLRIRHRNNNNYLNMVYNTAGQLVRIKEASGRLTKLFYNTDGKIKSIVDPLGRTVKYVYNSGNLVKVIDPGGDFVRFVYENGKLKKVINPRNYATIILYDESGRVMRIKDTLYNTNYAYYDNRTAVTDTYGHRIRYFLDAEGRCTRIKDTMDYNTWFQWDAAMNITRVQNQKNQATIYTYDDEANVLTSANSLYTVYYTYDSHNNMTSFKNGKGKTSTFTYTDTENDPYGILTSVTTPSGKISRFTYDENGQVKTVEDALHRTTKYDYDDNGGIIQVTDADNNSTNISRDAVGQVSQAKDALGRYTYFTYDLNGLVKSVKTPSNAITTYDYDANGNKTKVTDANNHSTTYTYDEDDRMLTVEDALNHTTTYTFDKGNLASTKDPMNFTTTMTYDANDRLLERTNNITTETFEYDELGNNTKKGTRLGDITIEYDELNRPVKRISSDKTAEFTYDNNGNILTVNTSGYSYCDRVSSFNTEFTYDDDDQLLSKKKTLGGTIIEESGYEYDDAGNLTNLQTTLKKGLPPAFESDTSTYSLTYQFDVLNRPTQVSNHTGDVFSAQYDAVGNMTRINYPDGTSSVREFDNENRITKVTNDNPTGDPPHIVYDYTYDDVGNFLSVKKTPSDLNPHNYQYDALNRLTKDESAGKEFEYDAAGNRTREDIGNGFHISYSYNNAHQLLHRTGSSGSGIPETSYNYDLNGNRKGKEYSDDPYGGRSETEFTASNKLKKISHYGGYIIQGTKASPGGSPTDKTPRSRDTAYRTDAFAYGGDDELFWEESKSDNMFMSPSMLKSGRIAGITKSGKATLIKDPKSGKVALVIPKVSDTSYNLDCTFHGYESGVLLFKKNISGAVLEGEASALWNKTEFYTYLNGLKVGIYTESEASDFIMDRGKEEKEFTNSKAKNKTGKFVGGPETHNYYCSYDGQGNITQVSNMAGDMPYNIYTYDSYGTQTGSDYSNESFSSYKGYDKGPFGYKTGVRQYDPETGRFLSPDAFKGYLTDPASQHPYMYSRGNPISYSDPSGYDSVYIATYQYTEKYVKDSDAYKRIEGIYGKNNVSVEYNPMLKQIKDAMTDNEIVIILGHGDDAGTVFGGTKSDSNRIRKADIYGYMKNNQTKVQLLYLSFCYSDKWDKLPVEFIAGYNGETNSTFGVPNPKDLPSLNVFFSAYGNNKSWIIRGAKKVKERENNFFLFRNSRNMDLQ